jgi:hypothetical protein
MFHLFPRPSAAAVDHRPFEQDQLLAPDDGARMLLMGSVAAIFSKR